MGDMDWILPAEWLENSPSRLDGCSKELEKEYRNKSSYFIETLAKELKCDRLVTSTACVLFNRFYAFQSFKCHERYIICATAVFLAAKVDEAPRHVKDVVAAYRALRSRQPNFIPDADSNAVLEKVLIVERILLQTLCFDLLITHPYDALLRKIKALRPYIPAESRKDFHQACVDFINDSYRTTLLLQYSPLQIAVGAMFMAFIHLSLVPAAPTSSSHSHLRPTSSSSDPSTSSISSSPNSWLDLLSPNINKDELRDICQQIMEVYTCRTVPSKLDANSIRSLESKLFARSSSPFPTTAAMAMTISNRLATTSTNAAISGTKAATSPNPNSNPNNNPNPNPVNSSYPSPSSLLPPPTATVTSSSISQINYNINTTTNNNVNTNNSKPVSVHPLPIPIPAQSSINSSKNNNYKNELRSQVPLPIPGYHLNLKRPMDDSDSPPPPPPPETPLSSFSSQGIPPPPPPPSIFPIDNNNSESIIGLGNGFGSLPRVREGYGDSPLKRQKC